MGAAAIHTTFTQHTSTCEIDFAIALIVRLLELAGIGFVPLVPVGKLAL